MAATPLSSAITSRVLAHLEVRAGSPDLALLDKLIAAYTNHVPWESAFRIVKKAVTQEVSSCPRWPEEFWADALERGGGGTCFESNYAFYGLLLSLGFEGYLTINNMAESIGCHTAIVVIIQGEKWLADVGLPLYAPLPLSGSSITRRGSPFHEYTVTPLEDGRYQIERSLHPQPYAFTLIDRPVSGDEYRQATTSDYGPHGHFLGRVIINKIINGVSWRFNAGERPWKLSSFANGEQFDLVLAEPGAKALADHFSINELVVQQALSITGSSPK